MGMGERLMPPPERHVGYKSPLSGVKVSHILRLTGIGRRTATPASAECPVQREGGPARNIGS
jgi:hypothetical protein